MMQSYRVDSIDSSYEPRVDEYALADGRIVFDVLVWRRDRVHRLSAISRPDALAFCAGLDALRRSIPGAMDFSGLATMHLRDA